jgi:hypothetical protein
LNTSTGSISGTPVEAIASPGRTVIITAVDAGGATAFQTHTFIINATVGSVNPSTVSRENIFSTVALTAINFTTTNLVAPITWAISSGTLPTGLNFNTSNGSITGTPSETIAAPGRQVIVRATDIGSLQGFSTVTFQINPPPELYAFTSATFTTGGLIGDVGPNISQARSGVGNPSWASTYLNMPVNGIQAWTVPKTGVYRIQATGGGTANNLAGAGAVVRGDFSLNEGDILDMAIGQVSNPSCSSGGYGGTFVARRVSSGGTSTVWGVQVTPLLVAGGGGGQTDGSSPARSTNGQMSTSGGGSPTGGQAVGGTNGNGGTSFSSSGGAGFIGNTQGGWNGNVSTNNRRTSNSFINNALGGPRGNYEPGGFGGGATNSCDVCNSAAHAGGGGGYSGGAGGGQSGGCYGPAGGGGRSPGGPACPAGPGRADRHDHQGWRLREGQAGVKDRLA